MRGKCQNRPSPVMYDISIERGSSHATPAAFAAAEPEGELANSGELGDALAWHGVRAHRVPAPGCRAAPRAVEFSAPPAMVPRLVRLSPQAVSPILAQCRR